MFIRKILLALIVTATVFVPQTFIFAQDQTCPDGQHWSENQMACVPDNFTQLCPDGQIWDDAAQGCVSDGNTNQTGGNTNQTGGNTNQTGGNTNQTCPDGLTWDAIIGQCIIVGGVINGNDDSGSGNGGSGTGGTGGNTGTSGACLTSFAIGQTPRNFCELMSLFLKLLNSIIPLLVALAIVFFIWGVIQYVINPASSEEREKGQQYMIWGIVGIFCIVSIWGLVALLTGTFGISTVVIPQLQQQ